MTVKIHTKLDLSAKKVTHKDVIDFVKAVRELRNTDESLPFGTLDYYRMDDILKFLEKKRARKK